MEWAILLLLAVVLAVHWFDYSRAVTEYTFAQPVTADNLRSVLSEKTPVVVEIGAIPWRPEIAANASWIVRAEEDGVRADEAQPEGQKMSEWLKGSGRTIHNNRALAEEMELATGLTDIDEGRSIWWLPGLYDVSVDILGADEVVGLSWVSAERQWIGCSSGGPLLVWLVHSRYRRYLPSPDAVNPWNLTPAEAPYIGRVQYIEVRIKPGWALGLPAHWGWALKNEGPEAWMWEATQQSGLSWCLNQLPSVVHNIQSHIESLSSPLEE